MSSCTPQKHRTCSCFVVRRRQEGTAPAVAEYRRAQACHAQQHVTANSVFQWGEIRSIRFDSTAEDRLNPEPLFKTKNTPEIKNTPKHSKNAPEILGMDTKMDESGRDARREAQPFDELEGQHQLPRACAQLARCVAGGHGTCNTKGYSSTYLAMGFANVRAGTRYPPEH